MLKQNDNRVGLPLRKQLSNQKERKCSLFIMTKSSQQKKTSEGGHQKSADGKENFVKRKSTYDNAEISIENTKKTANKIKAPLKLQLSQQFLNKTKLIFKNRPVSQKEEPQQEVLKNLKQQIVSLLFENRLIQKGYSNNVFLNLESLEIILHKFISIFHPKQATYKSQLQFLNCSMQRLKQLISSQKKLEYSKKLSLTKQLSVNLKSQQSTGAIKCVKNDLKLLNIERKALIEQKRQLQNKIQGIEITFIQKKMAIQQQIQTITKLRRQLQEYNQQKDSLQVKLEQLRSDHKKIQAEVLRIVNFVDNQNKNMHIRNASRYYKEIESEIYEYAAYLQANQKASSLQFQTLPLKNQIYVIERLENNISDLNRELVNNTELSSEDKGRMMRDFVLELNSQYRRKDQEQQKAIEFKTKCIRKFIQMMKLWIDNWTLKQELLVDLRKNFASNAFSLDQQLQNLFIEKLCPNCSLQIQNLKKKIQQAYKKMKQNYFLGNSFY